MRLKELDFRKGFVIFVFFIIISLFGFSQLIAAAPGDFTFTVDDGVKSQGVGSGSSPINFFTNSSTVTLRVSPDQNFASGSTITKDSDLSQWNGVESISGTKSWIINSLNIGQHYFKATIAWGNPLEETTATMNVIVQPTLNATFSCGPGIQVTLNWTDLSPIYSGVYYNLFRSDVGSSTPIVQTSTNSFIDKGSWAMAPNTPYTYTVRAIQEGVQGVSYIAHMNASKSVTTGICQAPESCGDGTIQAPEQCDNSTQNGVPCNPPPYGSTCVWCSSSTSPGGGVPACRSFTAQGGFCGNNDVETPQEQCDDGNTLNGDGCSSTCQNEQIGPACTFSSAAWNTTQAVEGQMVSLNVQGQNCNGKAVDFVIREEDCFLFGSCSYSVPVATISSTFSGTTWITQWMADSGGFGDPEYVFVATLNENPSVTATSGQLTVTPAPPPPPCGNGAVNANEQCDGGTGCTASCQCSAGYQPTSPLSVNCQPTIICGNGILDSGETCDDGNTNNGDGCSSTCQTESVCGNGVVEIGETCDDGNVNSGDLCSSTCQTEPGGPVCGNGICNAGETTASCPGDCPSQPSQCQLTSSAWSKTRATEGETVNLNVAGNNCNGQTVSFVVWEDDVAGDDAVTINPSNVVFGGNSATGSWIAEYQDDGLGEDPEYYFIASVSGAGSLSSGTGANQLLSVNQSSSISQCSGIAACGNYADPGSCGADVCSVADNSVPSGVDCNDPNIACSCAWNTTSSSCYANVGGPAGTCTYTQQTNDNCDDGFLTFSWTAQWTWFPGKTPADDPEGLYLQCVDGSKIVECPAQIALPFFNYYNLIVAFIMIGLIYWVLSMKKLGRKRKR